jgi:serine/threonine-protein kinase RsbW
MNSTSEHSFAISIELSLPSELGYEKVARDAIGAFARRIGFANERVEDLKTALSEACINAIEHGNQQAPGLRVSITCSYFDECLAIVIADQGKRPFAKPTHSATISEKIQGLANARGMGLSLIAGLVDEAGFIDHGGSEGNLFRMAIRKHPADIATGERAPIMD